MPAHPEIAEIERAAMRKIHRRLLSFISLLYFTAFLDRANVAYGHMTMALDLGFSEWVFGLGAGLFFLGYVLLEIPGALIVEKYGARRWTARILVTWGICTIALGFIQTSRQFYLGRFILGTAEAGFFPGMIVYLTRWVPSRHRAGAIATVVISSPMALALGGPIASVLLRVNWFGLAGWRWLSILEGIPAISLGVATWFFLTDAPETAKWLTAGERDWLLEELREEYRAKSGQTRVTALQAMRSPAVIALCAIIFLANVGIQGFFLWLPVTVQRASGLSAPLSALVSGLPFAVAVIAVVLCSWSSDRTNERIRHTWIPLVSAGIIFSFTAYDTSSLGRLLFFLCASGAAIYAFGPSFYLLPTLILSESAAAAAVGLINIFAALGGFAGPSMVGWLLSEGYPFSLAVLLLCLCFLLAGMVTFSIRRFWQPA
jgi:MFS transporter, ACS family, tartrate transporter